MTQHKRGLARTQTALLPAAVEDYVGAHDLVRVIDAYVNGLNMVALAFKHAVVLDEGRRRMRPIAFDEGQVFHYRTILKNQKAQPCNSSSNSGCRSSSRKRFVTAGNGRALPRS